MHLRISTIHRKNKTYRYAQLVESYRREGDGRPVHRVLANLGALDDAQVSNLRAALEANREGHTLVLPASRVSTARSACRQPVVQANYHYLDLAVLLRLWAESGIAKLLSDILPGGQEEVGADLVVTALALHRCVAPGSKLAAERWFPDTALPELLSVGPGQFNNTRVHRVLEALERVEPVLQTRLAHVVQRTQGACVRLFIDATDTWFVGQGPPLAAKGTDKEGLFRRRIGIVLLCDQRGFPLRWQTLSGTYHDATALLDMAKLAASLDWVKEQPVVLDRAVGNAAAFLALTGTGLRFVTALPWIEFTSSGAPIPWERVSALQAAALGPDTTEASIAAVGVSHGFSRPRADRFLYDLGIFEKAAPRSAVRDAATVVAMRFVEDIETSTCSMRALAAERGVSEASVRRHKRLGQLDPVIQRRTLAGEARTIGVDALHRIASLPATEQIAAFEAAIGEFPDRIVRARKTAPDPEEAPPIRARGVLSFNPERCRVTRRAEEQSVSKLHTAVADLNKKLATGSARRTDASVLAAAHKLILHAKMGNVFTARLVETGSIRSIVLDRDDAAWEARRKVDGLSIVVTHPDIAATPEEVVNLYFEKDAIEKDFQTIKSNIEIRPVYHQTDNKLRAHVTLCVLALLVQRILGERLRGTAKGMTAVAALETLASAHLNLVNMGKRSVHTVTKLSAAQDSLLAALAMEDLASDQQVAKAITPR
jgi:hypothetical protein